MKLIVGFFVYLIIPYSHSFEELKSNTKQWTAKWIEAPKNLIPEASKNLPDNDKDIFKRYPGLKPALFFRKTFHINEPVSKAILYCAAKGAFKPYLTDKKPLTYRNIFPTLTPGWTNYNKSIQYYTYDVTYKLTYFNNHTLGMVVGSGWYSGYIGNKPNLYGNEQSALVELHIQFESGSSTVITSDESWKVNTGDVLYSDFERGELIYENRLLYNWTLYTYNDANWSSVVTHPTDNRIEFVEDTSPIQELNAGTAKTYWKVGPNSWVYSFNDIIYGGIMLTISSFPYTALVQVRYGEAIYPNGSLYTGKGRSTSVTNTYVLNDAVNRPTLTSTQATFTAHSFKYVEISGYPVAFYAGEVSAYKYSQLELSSSPITSSKLINDLLVFISRSMEANLNSIPMTAHSDETRVGWLEPAGLFSSTAFSIGNVRKFYRKWLNDITNSQAPSGAYSDIAPNVNDLGDASPGSGFAPILIAYNLYKYHEDVDAVKESYVQNQNWVKYVISNNPDFLYTNKINKDFGDYANVNAETPKEVISTAYFALSSLYMSKLAQIVNKPADKVYYEALHKNISIAFVNAYVNSTDGKINGDTQTGYVLALVSKVLPETLIPKVVKKLVDDIKAHDYHLTTGYAGTAFILPVLADYGHIDVAYRVLQQNSYPSWGYMLETKNMGGLWERWNSWTENDGFQGSSFNSIGLGTVGSFLYEYIGGIGADEEQISFKKVVIKPYIGEGVTSFSGFVETNYGLVESSWKIVENTFTIQVILPENTDGKLILPFASKTWIRELLPGKQNFAFDLKTNKQ